MAEEGIDFSEIQKMFAHRDEKSEKDALERRSQLKLVKVPTTTIIKPIKDGLEYKKIELRDEPAYDNMHAKNIKVTKKGYELSKTEKLIIKICAVIIVVAIGIITAIELENHFNRDYGNDTGSVYHDKNYEKDKETKPHSNSTEEMSKVINPSECNLSNFTIVLRQSTTNANKVVSVAERELHELGVDNRVVSYNDDIVDVVENLKNENPKRDIIVINVDGKFNKGPVETVVMTNYSNDAKSADALALAINNANEGIYGINSEVRCGKKTSDGSRTETSVEKALHDAGHNDVVCLTIAPTTTCIDSEIEINNLATSIVEGVIRFASLDNEDRYADIIRRVEYGDTINGLATSHDVSEAYIRSANSEVLSENNGILKHDTAMIVTKVPSNLTSEVTVNNPTITTNPNDVTTKILYYEVSPGDTVSEIAEKLGVSQEELVVPSGNPDKIFPGDKIGYETEAGRILVSKITEKSK